MSAARVNVANASGIQGVAILCPVFEHGVITHKQHCRKKPVLRTRERKACPRLAKQCKQILLVGSEKTNDISMYQFQSHSHTLDHLLELEASVFGFGLFLPFSFMLHSGTDRAI